jgi:Holliday junction resolvase RusA-like endonuclease
VRLDELYRQYNLKANSIVLSGEPKSAQHIYGLTYRGRFATRYMTPEGRALKEQYQWDAKAQWHGPQLQGDISMSVTFHFATKRKRDWIIRTSSSSMPSRASHMARTIR